MRELLLQGCWNETLGVATTRLLHDFNNFLTGILSLSDAYLSDLKPDHPLREGLVLMNQNAREAAQIVQSIGRLYREVSGPPSYQNINELVGAITALLQKVLPRHMSAVADGASASLPVYVDPVEFRKMVLTTALLLAEALPHPGELHLRTSSAPPTFAVDEAPSGQNAWVEISAEVTEAQRGLIDPFFGKCESSEAKRGRLVRDLAEDFLSRNRGGLITRLEKGHAAVCFWLPQSDFTEMERDLARQGRA